MKTIIERARDFAYEKHKGQKDDEGREYILHPMTVAHLLGEVGADADTIAAGWLHDVIEDCGVTHLQLIVEFGKDVADLVNEVTHEGDKKTGYTFPRLKTQRGIMIKFADRLHNISRMSTWDEKRKKQYLKKSKFWI